MNSTPTQRRVRFQNALNLSGDAALARFTLLKRRERQALSIVSPDLTASLAKQSEDVATALADPLIWAQKYTQTYNEHWVEENRPSAYEPFPDLPYLGPLFDVLQAERIIWIEKSRDMMVSWVCVAYLLWEAIRVPERGVIFQTQKEEKAKQLIKYAKCLYDRQPDWLKAARPLYRQSDLSIEFTNGSKVMGIPGGADQIRSYHPYAYLNDESSFQPEAGECYNEALAAVRGKIIFNSTAGPSWYADARRDIVANEDE
jgi:hypothetical protein